MICTGTLRETNAHLPSQLAGSQLYRVRPPQYHQTSALDTVSWVVTFFPVEVIVLLHPSVSLPSRCARSAVLLFLLCCILLHDKTQGELHSLEPLGKTFPTFHISALSVPQTRLSTVALLFLTVATSQVSHLGPLSSKAYTVLWLFPMSCQKWGLHKLVPGRVIPFWVLCHVCTFCHLYMSHLWTFYVLT